MRLPSVVIDTNILFSTLLSSQSRFAATILRGQAHWFVCDSVIVELFEHKERLVTHSKQTESELLGMLHDILGRIRVYQEDLIRDEHWREAYQLCREIDSSDTPHVALTLELDALLWTGDKKLRDGLRAQGFERFFVTA